MADEDYGQAYLKRVQAGTHDDDVAQGMERAGKYMRGMNTLAAGASGPLGTSGVKTAGQRGAEEAADAADYTNKKVGRKLRDEP